jgi:hypothetical protein
VTSVAILSVSRHKYETVIQSWIQVIVKLRVKLNYYKQ